MNNTKLYDVIIIGGGLAGLTCGLHLSQQGVKVLLIEKNQYPHHKVCGEYISNEVLPYLQSLGVDPFSEGAVAITDFQISTTKGKSIETALPLGGFGISRYTLDHLLFKVALRTMEVEFDTVSEVSFEKESFFVSTQSNTCYTSTFVVGAYGKRANLDKVMKRDFIQQKSPWLAVKAHYDYTFPKDKVALHNFEGGYCGLSKVENEAVNACYLVSYDSFKKTNSIEGFQNTVMSKNPHLAHFFSKAKLRFKKPLSISQISFQKKAPVAQHIFMIGDSAGLIHPLCGNGMAMAIHGAKLFSELFINEFKKIHWDRASIETSYSNLWSETFVGRLQTGRFIQKLLLNPRTAHFGMTIAQQFPSLVPKIIKKTHGKSLV